MAVRRAYYAPFAAAMAAEGVPTLTYDFRGIGGSRLPRVRDDPATMRDWARLDMPAAIAAARDAFPGRPLVMLGHSAGGWLAGLCPEAATLEGLVLVASQDGHWRHWRGASRYRLWGVWHVGIPLFAAALGRVPGWAGLGQDVPAGVAREWAAWGRRRGFVEGEADYARLRMPTLALRVSDDGYAPAAAVEALLARFPQERLQRRVLDGLGHFGYFREERGALHWKEMASDVRGLSRPAGGGAGASR